MKSRLSKIIMGILACLAVMLMFNVKAHAANASISVSSGSGNVGDNVTVNVTVTPDAAVMSTLIINYDTNYLDYVPTENGARGTGGTLKSVLDIANGTSGTVQLVFKLKQAGTGGVYVGDATEIIAVDGTDDTPINYTKTNGTITANAATSASGDCTLSGLSVQAVSQSGDSITVSYAPNFSPDVYEYKADLPANTIKLVVATTLSDANATTKVSGTRIDPGDNKTTITVVAENGTQQKYILYTTRAAEDSTEPSSEGQSEGQTTAFDRSPKKIDGLGMYMIQDFTLITIPEGFEESTATYNGETIAVLKGIAKELTLVCLAADAQGTNANLYIYNEASGAIDKMVSITNTQKIYTIIPTGSDYVGPAGYTETTLEIGGEKVKAWIKEGNSEFYIVYAMNWNGEKALYVYDAKEQTMQRFVEGNKSETFDDEPEEENKEFLAMKKQYDDMYSEYVNDHSKKNKLIIGMGIVFIIILIGLVLLIYKYRNGHFASEDEEDLEEIGDENTEKELKLDMVAQVNEVKVEKLAAQVSEMMNDNENTAENVIEESNDMDIANEIEANTQELDENVLENSTLEDNTEGNIEDNVADEKSDEVSSIEEAIRNELGVEEVKNDEDEHLINMEDDDPFEIEFVDLNDGNDNK